LCIYSKNNKLFRHISYYYFNILHKSRAWRHKDPSLSICCHYVSLLSSFYWSSQTGN